jgi:hypothetical protein
MKTLKYLYRSPVSTIFLIVLIVFFILHLTIHMNISKTVLIAIAVIFSNIMWMGQAEENNESGEWNSKG